MTFAELFSADVTIVRDIAYRTDIVDERHVLDVYAPPASDRLPVVVFFYGGGWRSGDKRLFEHLGRSFALRGIVAVVVNYRLTPQVKSPSHIDDCAAACAWTQQNIQKHGGDPGRIALMGHSAGAHLATLLTVDDTHLRRHGFEAQPIAVVSVSGVYDLSSHVDSTVFTSAEHVREAFGQSDEELAASSPLRFVRSELPPFLVIVAEHDPEGLREQAREFVDALREAGNAPMFLSVKGRDHFSIVRRFGPSSDTTATAIAEFIHHVADSAEQAPLA